MQQTKENERKRKKTKENEKIIKANINAKIKGRKINFPAFYLRDYLRYYLKRYRNPRLISITVLIFPRWQNTVLPAVFPGLTPQYFFHNIHK